MLPTSELETHSFLSMFYDSGIIISVMMNLFHSFRERSTSPMLCIPVLYVDMIMWSVYDNRNCKSRHYISSQHNW